MRRRAAFFAAFVGATFTAAFLTAVFFVTAFFVGAFAAAFCKRQRFFVAAMILFIPSSLIRRFAFGALAGADGSDSPLILAHRFLCCDCHPSPCASGNLVFPGSAFRPGGGFSGATGQHGSEFGDLGVDVPLLFLESKDGGGDDFGCEFCWHVILSHHPR